MVFLLIINHYLALEASPAPAAFFFPGPSLTALTKFYSAFEF